MTSPAERYAASRRRAREQATELHAFRSLYPFELDDFQVEACRALEDGRGVLVAAPTGSGKTVVGEFAVHLAIASGTKCFYTTPIKALSNQKFHDLVERYGPERVGLLTGDNTINGEAPVVVMTTEVLRNMLYAGSLTLSGLSYVVMDEVHYLADRFRGAVWEEVLIQLPEHVAVVALSATVSNAEEFGDWLRTVRGDTEVVVEEHRPVPLWQHVMAGPRLYDLFVDDEQTRVNPELVRLARDEQRADKMRDVRPQRGRRRLRGPNTPSRVEVVERLGREGLLPAIVFIFSRAGCDAAVRQCLAAGLRLTDGRERDRIRAIAEQRCVDLAREDLAVLGYGEWLDGLERGIASHHAGLLPTFKEVVEELFQEGLIKVVFATETLALGINMPARSVVLERLIKWNGEAHVDISAGEYTQLTGRAGRRGIDVEGHGIVVWFPGLDPGSLAGLASTRTYPLRSSFRPSYNMAVNLVAQLGRHAAREVLETSFAQFQADRAVVGLAAQVRRNEEALEGYREAMSCHLGDFEEYARLRNELSQRERELSKHGAAQRRSRVADSLVALRPGDVVFLPSGRRTGPVVVVDRGFDERSGEARPLVVTLDRQLRRVTAEELSAPLESVLHLHLGRSFSARSATARRHLAQQLRDRTHGMHPPKRGRTPSTAADDQVIRDLRNALRHHPCHGCDQREDHARWAERYYRLERDTAALVRRVESRTNTIARQFDRVCEVLHELGYLSSDGDDAVVTEPGRTLMRLYGESDLLAAECLRTGPWDGLGPAELACVAAALVYEGRGDDDEGPPRLPGGRVREVLHEMVSLWGDLDDLEKRHQLSFLREPDLGFCWAAHRWASGARLESVLLESALTPGDFVRWCKQVIDVLGQIADAAGADTRLRETAHAAADRVTRGVVAYSSVG
ncbi:MAG: DEAD/DEAH box helicase [Candidatus Nanopelagicales bacterium]